jgi:hypothetical protein
MHHDGPPFTQLYTPYITCAHIYVTRALNLNRAHHWYAVKIVVEVSYEKEHEDSIF